MTNQPEEQVSPETVASATSPSPNPVARRIALAIVLVLLLVALVYDYGVARPSVNQAYDAVMAKFQDANLSAVTLTRGEVESLLDRPSSETFSDGANTVDVYQWASGLPLKHHDLFVVYRPGTDSDEFVRHFKFAYEPGGSMQVATAEALLTERVGRENSTDSAAAPTMTKIADGSGTKSVAVPETSAADPTSLPPFAELDGNEDGVLEASEWPDQYKSILKSMDADGDGTVDAKEFAAAGSATSDPGEAAVTDEPS
ncbi:MAG: hypothetical protein AAGC97_02820 [Planctomycetota bacterium]